MAVLDIDVIFEHILRIVLCYYSHQTVLKTFTKAQQLADAPNNEPLERIIFSLLAAANKFRLFRCRQLLVTVSAGSKIRQNSLL